MTKFEKPGSRDWDYPDMGKEAANKALADAGLPYSVIQQACIGYVYGDSTSGQVSYYIIICQQFVSNHLHFPSFFYMYVLC
jgi:hypothetical protein